VNCPKCMSMIQTSDQFCGQCGTKLTHTGGNEDHDSKRDKAHAMMLEGIKLHNLGQFDQALALYEQANKIDPTNADVYFNIGEIFRLSFEASGTEEDFRTSEMNYQKAIEIEPNIYDTYASLGLLYYQAGQDKNAEDNYNIALSMKSDLAEALFGRGVLYAAQNKHKKSIQDFNLLIESHADFDLNDVAFLNRGSQFLKLGDHYQAKSDFEAAIRFTDDPEIQFQAETMLSDLS